MAMGNVPRHFELWSSEEDDTASSPFSKLPRHASGEFCATTDLTCETGHQTIPLRLQGDIEDVEVGNWTMGVKGCTSWMKRPEFYCFRGELGT
ncbi:hypothetical protein TNCV_267591 [Trichonephila clavipes]|nr:hypothetical protein TNCV_267591 [Trichonephila clavipes]